MRTKTLQKTAVANGTQDNSKKVSETKTGSAEAIVSKQPGADTEEAGTNNTIALMPPPQPPVNTLTRRASNYNLSGLSKDMRRIIQAKEQDANNTIAETFKNALLDPASTQDDIRASLSPLPYSTLKGDIKFNNNGSIRCNTLDKLLKQAFTDAETQMRITLQGEFDTRFNAQATHTPAELQELDEMCKRIKEPFKNRFPLQNAQAA